MDSGPSKPTNEDSAMANPLQRAAFDGNEKIGLLLLKYGTDVDSCLPYGFTALDRAAGNGHGGYFTEDGSQKEKGASRRNCRTKRISRNREENLSHDRGWNTE